jgi:hypothetical protein
MASGVEARRADITLPGIPQMPPGSIMPPLAWGFYRLCGYSG